MIYLIFKKKKELALIAFFFILFFLFKSYFYNTYSYLFFSQNRNQMILEKDFKINQANSQLLNLVSQENDELKSFLGRGGEKKYILAYVLANKKNLLDDYLILDIGSNNGLKLGARVYSQNKVLLGKIIQVENNISKVELISRAPNQYLVQIRENSYTAESIGDGNFVVNLNYQIKDKLFIGDNVFLGEDFIGQIVKINNFENDLTSQIYLAQKKNIFKISRVYVEN